MVAVGIVVVLLAAVTLISRDTGRHARHGATVALAGAVVQRPSVRASSEPRNDMVDATADCGSSSESVPRDRLEVVGRRLKDTAGHVIIPEGISVVGGPEAHDYRASRASTYAQLEAAHAAWHVNSERLQVSESSLIKHPTRGHGYNRPFANYLNRIICRILSYHEIPIVNVNTWFTGGQRNPTSMTVKFWDYMSVNFRRRPVIFDLFNEPRLKQTKRGTPLSPGRVWRLWKWGGTVSGVHYVGMQPLVNDIRRRFHADNVIWVESAYETSETAELPGHLIRGRNIMYSFHKLHLDEPSLWHAVGRLANRGIALVDGEWAQFAALHRPWECYDDAYTMAPRYLSYWKREGVGFEAWSLQYGALARARGHVIVQDGNYHRFPTNVSALEIPNSMRANYGCDAQSLGQGAGRMVMRYFKQNTVPAPRALFATGG